MRDASEAEIVAALGWQGRRPATYRATGSPGGPMTAATRGEESPMAGVIDRGVTLVARDLVAHAALLAAHIPKPRPRWPAILAARFGLAPHTAACTLAEAGRFLGISEQRVWQIEQKAMEALRRSMLAAGDDEP